MLREEEERERKKEQSSHFFSLSHQKRNAKVIIGAVNLAVSFRDPTGPCNIFSLVL